MIEEGSMICPRCNKELIITHVKYPNTDVSHPIGCPNCDYTIGTVPKGTDDYLVNLKQDESDTPNCPKCKNKMILKSGPYEKFWGCKNYPVCDGSRNIY